MTKITTFDTPEGTITINSEDLTAFNLRARAILAEIAAQQDAYKELVQEVVDATKLKKAKVSKYFKQRFDFKTKATVAEGELFEKLDSTLDGEK